MGPGVGQGAGREGVSAPYMPPETGLHDAAVSFLFKKNQNFKKFRDNMLYIAYAMRYTPRGLPQKGGLCLPAWVGVSI